MEVELINIKQYEGTDYIYIGRPGQFGNPFSSKESNIATNVESKEISVEKFREYLEENPKLIDKLIKELRENVVHKLGCWCKNSGEKGICHGDVYLEKINERKFKSIL
tara:strand:+ start:334 stop:657 length:324 start_codon:yes stop_codon:yes gene_type:complete